MTETALVAGFVVTVHFDVRPGCQAAFEEAMLENARASLAGEPGCLQFDVCRDGTASTRFFLYEVYRTRADFDVHVAAPHFLAFSRLTAPWIVDKRIETRQLLTLGPQRRPR